MTECKEKGNLIVLSGPSGAGKSTVLGQFLQKRPDIHFSVSYTTRTPRPGEVDGVNYNFVDEAEFRRMIEAGELLEYTRYVDHYYGTSLKIIRDYLDRGTDVLLDIEVQGAANVRRKAPDAILIFLVPPSFAELSRRLHARGTDSEDVIQGRLRRAREEFRQIPNYDYIVINDRMEQAADEIRCILQAQDCRTANRMNFVEKEIMSYDALS